MAGESPAVNFSAFPCHFGFSSIAGDGPPTAELIASTYERLWRELGTLHMPASEIPESPFEVPPSSERDLSALQKSLRQYEQMLARQGWLSLPIVNRLKEVRSGLLRQAVSAEQVRTKKIDQNVAQHVKGRLHDGTVSPDGLLVFASGSGTNATLATTNLATGKSVEQRTPLMIHKGMLATGDGKYLAMQSNLNGGDEINFFPIENGDVNFSAGFGIFAPQEPRRWFEALRKKRRPWKLNSFVDSGNAGFLLGTVSPHHRLCLFDIEKRRSKLVDPAPLGLTDKSSLYGFGPIPGSGRAYFSFYTPADHTITLKTARVTAGGLTDVETFHTWSENNWAAPPTILWTKDHGSAVSFFSDSFDSLTLVQAKGDEKIGESRPNRKERDKITHAFFSADGKHLAVFVRNRWEKNLTFHWYDLDTKQWSLDTRPLGIPCEPGPIASPDHTKLFFQPSPTDMTVIPLVP